VRRWKNPLRWVELALAAVVATALIVNAGLVWRSNARLQRKLVAIREAGDPTSLADLEREPLPAAENAATYLGQADANVAAICKAMEQTPGAIPQYSCLPQPDNASAGLAVKRVLDAHPKAIPLLQQAAACRDTDWQLDYTLPPLALTAELLSVPQRYAAYARVLLYGRAVPLLAEGKGDEAVHTIAQTLRLARQADCAPLLLAYLSMIRVRFRAMDCADAALQAGPLSKAARDALDAELAVEERMEGYALAVRGQRAAFLDEFATIPHRQDWFLNRVNCDQQESECLDALAFDLAIVLDCGPYRDTAQRIRQRPQRVLGVGGGMLPEIRVAQLPVAQLRAKIRALRVLNALGACPPADAKHLPPLSELGLPAEAVSDPFTGAPLHVKRHAKGWLVYSVGENFRDDGGSSQHPHDDIRAGRLPP
jgi:hypothetical protein